MKKLLLIIAMLFFMILGFSVVINPDTKYHAISIENQTSNLIAFVTIVKIDLNENGGVKQMNLYWSEWLEPHQKGIAYMVKGEYYAVLIEVWKYNPDTRLPERKVGESYKEGRYNNTGTNKIEIRNDTSELQI